VAGAVTRTAALEAVAEAARKLMACKTGFHPDYEGLHASRKELRAALDGLDALDAATEDWRRDRPSAHWVKFSEGGPWQICHWIVPTDGEPPFWTSWLDPVEIGPALPPPPTEAPP